MSKCQIAAFMFVLAVLAVAVFELHRQIEELKTVVQTLKSETVVQKGRRRLGDPVLIPQGHVVKSKPKTVVQEKELSSEQRNQQDLIEDPDPNAPYVHLKARYEWLSNKIIKKATQEHGDWFEWSKEITARVMNEINKLSSELFASVDPKKSVITIANSAAKYFEIVKCSSPYKPFAAAKWEFKIIVLIKELPLPEFGFKVYDSSDLIIDGGNFYSGGAHAASKGDKFEVTANLSPLWRLHRIIIVLDNDE